MPIQQTIYNKRYQQIQMLGSGSYGLVFEVFDTKTKQRLAVKIDKNFNGKLHGEYEVYKRLKTVKDRTGFVRIHDFFHEGGRQHMVIDLVGKSLKDLLAGRRFNLKSVLLIAIQLIDRLAALHETGYLHRDIKPDNMAMGIGKDAATLFLLDFGIHKHFMCNGRHVPREKRYNVIGNINYTSLNSHRLTNQSRRDDLETVGYVLLELLSGNLPWFNRSARTIERKKSASPQELFRKFDPVFATYLTYARTLRFEQMPDYKYLKKLFVDVFKKKKYEYDNIYCWTLPTSHAVIEKKKKEEAALREHIKREKLKRLRERKQAWRKRIHQPGEDLLMPFPGLSLYKKRQLILDSMKKNAFFPTLVAPFIPPTKVVEKQDQEEPREEEDSSMIEGNQENNNGIPTVINLSPVVHIAERNLHQVEDKDLHIGDDAEDVVQNKSVSTLSAATVIVDPAPVRDMPQVVDMIVNSQLQDDHIEISLQENHQPLDTNAIVDVKPSDQATENNKMDVNNKENVSEPLRQPMKIDTAAVSLLKPVGGGVVKLSKSKKKTLRRKAKKKAKKEAEKQRLEEIGLKLEEPVETRKTRKEQQAELLAMAIEHAKRCEDIKQKMTLKKDFAYNIGRKPERLPAFQQYVYDPRHYDQYYVQFRPKFADDLLYDPLNTPHDSVNSFFLF